MSKIKIAVSSIYYPVYMGKYIVDAIKRRDDVELFTVGPFTGTWIPWAGGIHLAPKYQQCPDFPLPQNLIGQSPPSVIIKDVLPWEPDLFLMIDAGFHFIDRPPGKKVGLIKTDPHALNYDRPKKYVDISWSMQTPYAKPDDLWLPYAADTHYFYPVDKPKVHDACMIGLQYQHRASLARELKGRGYDVFFDIGIVYDEYREKYTESRTAISWASKDDLPCRVFEAMAMKVPLITNRIPDLEKLFNESQHYLGFDTTMEARESVRWVLNHPDEAQQMAERAYDEVIAKHTWDHRMQQVLEDAELV